MEKATVGFVIVHRETGKEIEMPVLSLCTEYSNITFSAEKNAYDGEYDGIGRLPDSYTPNSHGISDYDVFVVINGERFAYNGLWYSEKSSSEESRFAERVMKL